MSEDNDRFEAMRATVTRSAGVTEDSISRFLSAQSAFESRRFRVILDTGEVKAGVSAGHLFFKVADLDEPASAVCGDFVLRYDVGESRLFLQTSLEQQFQVMRALAAHQLPAPEALWFDGDGVIAMSPALIMRRVEAIPPHLLYMQGGPYIEASADKRRQMLANLMGFCRRLHALPLGALGLGFLGERGGSGHFIDREINWIQHELHARFPKQEAEGERGRLLSRMRSACDEAADWLRENAPRHVRPVLVHGDVTLANVMFRDDASVAAVLDWELCHEGLPGEDVTWPHLAARAAANFYGASTDQMPSLEAYRDAYLASGGELQELGFSAALSAFRMVSISALAMRGMPPAFWGSQAADWSAQEALLNEQIQRAERRRG